MVIDDSINKAALKKGIKFVTEVLFSILFETENIFKEDESLIDEQNIDSLITYFTKYPRTPLNVVKGSQINNDLYSIFSSYLQKIQRQPFEFKDLSFYDSNSGTIRIYTVKSKMIDFYLLFLIILYLLLLFIYTKGLKNFWISLKNSFSEEWRSKNK